MLPGLASRLTTNSIMSPGLTTNGSLDIAVSHSSFAERAKSEPVSSAATKVAAKESIIITTKKIKAIFLSCIFFLSSRRSGIHSVYTSYIIRCSQSIADLGVFLSLCAHLLVGLVTKKEIKKELVVNGSDTTVLVDISLCCVLRCEYVVKELNLIRGGVVTVDVDISKSLGGYRRNRTEVIVNCGSVVSLENLRSRESGSCDLECDIGTSYNVLLNVEVKNCEGVATVESLVSGILAEAISRSRYYYEASSSAADLSVCSSEDSLTICILSGALELAGNVLKNVSVIVKTKSDVCKVNVSCIVLNGKLDLTAVYILSAGNDSVVDLVAERDTTKSGDGLGSSNVATACGTVASYANLGFLTLGVLTGSKSLNPLIVVTGRLNDLIIVGLAEALTIYTYPSGVTVLGTGRSNSVLSISGVRCRNILVTTYAMSVSSSVGALIKDSAASLVGVDAGSRNGELLVGLNVAIEGIVSEVLALALGALVVSAEAGRITVRIYLLNKLTELVALSVYVVVNVLITAKVAVVVLIAGSKALCLNKCAVYHMTNVVDRRNYKLCLSAGLDSIKRKCIAVSAIVVCLGTSLSTGCGNLGNFGAPSVTLSGISDLGVKLGRVEGYKLLCVLVKSVCATCAVGICESTSRGTSRSGSLNVGPGVTVCLNNYLSIVGVDNLLALGVNKDLISTLLTYIVIKVTIGGAACGLSSYLRTSLGSVLANHAAVCCIEGLLAVGAGVIYKSLSIARAGPVDTVCLGSAGSNCCCVCSCSICILDTIVPYSVLINSRVGMMLCIVVYEGDILYLRRVVALRAKLGNVACDTDLRIGRGGITLRKSSLLVESRITVRIGVVKSGIKKLSLGITNLVLVVNATVSLSYTVVGVVTEVSTGRSLVNTSAALNVVTKLAKIKLAVGSVVLVILGEISRIKLYLSRGSVASATLILKVTVLNAVRKDSIYILKAVVAESVNGMLLINAAKCTPVKSNTLFGTSRRGGDNSLGSIPLVNVGLRIGKVVLTAVFVRILNGYALVDINDSIAVGISPTAELSLTILEGITTVLAVRINSNRLPIVAGSILGYSVLIITIVTLVNGYGCRSAIAIGNGLGGVVRKHGNSKNAIGNPLTGYLVAVCSLDSLGRNSSVASIRAISLKCRSTTNAASVEPEAVLGTGGSSISNGSGEIVVVLSRIYNICRLNKIGLVEGKCFTNRTLEVSLNAILLTAIRNGLNSLPLMTKSIDYKSISLNLCGAVNGNCITVSALLVIKDTGAVAISGRAGNRNSEAMYAGSSKAERRIKSNLISLGGAVCSYVGNSNLVLNNLKGLLAGCAVNSTGACSAASRLSGNYSLASIPVVCKRTGSEYDNLLSLVRAVGALYKSKAGLVAVGLNKDLCNIAVAVATRDSVLLPLLLTELAGLNPSRNAILTLKAIISGAGDSGSAVSVLVLERLDRLGEISAVKSGHLGEVLLINGLAALATVVGASTSHYAILVTSGLSRNSPFAPSMRAITDLGPVGEYGRLTSFTLVIVVALYSTLRSNGLNKHYRSVCHSVCFSFTGARNSVIVSSGLCENGNNAANAHHDGKEKSTNSFRIVLH